MSSPCRIIRSEPVKGPRRPAAGPRRRSHRSDDLLAGTIRGTRVWRTLSRTCPVHLLVLTLIVQDTGMRHTFPAVLPRPGLQWGRGVEILRVRGPPTTPATARELP